MNRLFVGVVLLAAACSQITAPKTRDVVVTLSVSEGEVSVGDPILVWTVARNVGTDRAEFATNSCALVVRLLDASGDQVADFPSTCNDIELLHSLDPGESIESTVEFDGTYFRPSQENGAAEEVSLEPGPYRLVAGISPEFWNESDPVEIVVRE